MPRRLNLDFCSETTTAEFPDEEWDTLLAFTNYTLEMEKAKSINALNVNLTVTAYTEDGRVDFKGRLPTDDRIDVLLHRLRPFVLQSERTQFGKVCNILKRRISLESFRDRLEAMRSEFLGKRTRERFEVSIDETIVNSEATLMTWLNAHQYHRDPEKQKELEPLMHLFPDKFTKGVFVILLTDKARAVMRVGQFVWSMRRAADGNLAFDLSKFQNNEQVVTRWRLLEEESDDESE